MADQQVKPPTPFIEEFPFKPKDILSSFDVMGMTSAEFGIYCKILFVSWLQQPQCFLKLDEHNICEMCNVTPEEWKAAQARVIKKFELTYREGGTPYIHNKKLLGIYTSLIKGNKEVKKKHIEEAAELLNYPFSQFWNDYGKKVGDKNRVIPKWLKLKDAEREIIRQDIPKRKELQPKKNLRPNPETYLNGRRWEDEYIDHRQPVKQGSRANADYNGQQSNAI